MDFFSNLVAKVGGEDALNLVNDQLTPLLLNSFKPKIFEYVSSHVERTRGELFQQLPDGRGEASESTRGIFDDLGEQIRRKIDVILEEIRQRIREIVQNVTSSTSDRVTGSVVEIAQNKLKLKTRAIQENQQLGEGTRGFNFGGSGDGDFIDNFINSSLEEVRPLVRGELKSIYDHIIDLVPQDARKILVSLVPGLEDNQSQNNSQSQQALQGQQYNNNSRGVAYENEEPRSRGFLSDVKNFAHQVKNTVQNELKTGVLGGMGGSRGGAELLQEFQAKAQDKISKITTDLMNQLENKIMVTVSEELRTVAKSKLAGAIQF
ncbi:hypothetical protein L0F63_005921 [Massospora cicadina]|nr:hypothetical protein L0F63_005921 [Massospora cicadina]